MQCPSCNEEIKDTAKWCGHCGHKIEQVAPQSAPEPTGELVVKKEKAASPIIQEKPPKPKPVPLKDEKTEEVVLEKKEEKVAPKIKEEPKPKGDMPVHKEELPAPKPDIEKKKKKMIPIWLWILIVVFLGIGGAFGFQLFAGKEEITLSWTCKKNITVQEGTALEISYGYWGYLNAYHQENYDAIDFKLYIDGERYYGERQKTPLKLSEVPCGTSRQFNDYWEENSSWIYDVVKIKGLPAGKYQVDVFTYSDFDIVDGTKDDDGSLLHFGPGEIFENNFTLTVR